MRKILFFQWNAFMQKGIERAFTDLGMEYDTFYYIFTKSLNSFFSHTFNF